MALSYKEKLIECIDNELQNGGTLLLLTNNNVVSEISYYGNGYKYFTFNTNHDLISQEELKGATSNNIARMIYNWIMKNPQNNKIWNGEPQTRIYFENNVYHTNYNHECIKDFWEVSTKVGPCIFNDRSIWCTKCTTFYPFSNILSPNMLE
ncbi:pA151R [African swine fever virus]|uniref:Protein A151R n=1 Tax=African swine fever virus (isolate Tick/Malawi/Lil 20-1/1983) TaxID=10500 RepID=VF151_ASFM2|nr:RecName: Full=Protein A151R; Short=pA151R [African swine fever virus Malawi LIL 20/1]WRY69313.1 pA151R [African swine fever virus]